MPLTVIDCKGLSASGRERIEAAVTASAHRVTKRYEAWIVADAQGLIRMTITGPHGFARHVLFALDEEPAIITDRVRQTLDDD